jgi:hypothetical protein
VKEEAAAAATERGGRAVAVRAVVVKVGVERVAVRVAVRAAVRAAVVKAALAMEAAVLAVERAAEARAVEARVARHGCSHPSAWATQALVLASPRLHSVGRPCGRHARGRDGPRLAVRSRHGCSRPSAGRCKRLLAPPRLRSGKLKRCECDA